MHINSTEIVDTFAEAFAMWAARIIITADTPEWALAAARSMTGFATSVIGCKCEAGIERELNASETPDGRPGISALLFAMDAEGLEKRLVERIGQCVMTCPTTSCFNGIRSERSAVVGGSLRYFGDGFQISKKLEELRLWRIPVMDGEFVVEDRFCLQPAIGGGNLLLLGVDRSMTLEAARAAVSAMRLVAGTILPFPDGVVRSGSKVGSRYKTLLASTNHFYCPTLRATTDSSPLPANVNCVLEIVVDGLDEAAVREAMRRGMNAAALPGIVQISAGNYGGTLGKYRFDLHGLAGGTP